MTSIPSGRRPDSAPGRSGLPSRRAVRGVPGPRALVAVCLAAWLLSGCQQDVSATVDAKPPPASVRPTVVAPPPARIAVTPKGGLTDVDPGRAVTVHVTGGTLTTVEVVPTDPLDLSGDGSAAERADPGRGPSGFPVGTAASAADGEPGTAAEVSGVFGAGKRSWRSTRTMTPGTRYTVYAVARNRAAKPTTVRTSFTTWAAPFVNEVSVTPAGGEVVGVGHPVSIRFAHPVENKADVERHLSVVTAPSVEGSWGWVRDEETGQDRVDWRPRRYWASGTRVALRAELSGVDTGGGRYVLRDVLSTFTVGMQRISRVDLRRKTMRVYEDGRKVRTIPVSGGKPRYPTWNGTMVVLGKEPSIRMTSLSVDIGEFYDKTVYWAVHLTASGTYAHAAPWNAGLFGRVNASHGCIGMSDADGRWFFERAMLGDVVEVTGSSRETVPVGNGFGDWNPSFDEWRKLSALR